jgi:citrate synthase
MQPVVPPRKSRQKSNECRRGSNHAASCPAILRVTLINPENVINMTREPRRKASRPDGAIASVSPVVKAHADYATAQEAIEMLNVRAQTLYAYVSRGLVRSIPQPGHKGRLYRRDDLKRLEARSLARNGHGAVAASAMNFGEPIISTSITEITADGPRYRGRMALDLARARVPFEAVAQLLWTGIWNDNPPLWPRGKSRPDLNRLIESSWALRRGNLLEIFAVVALQLGGRRQAGGEYVDDAHTLDAGRQIIQTLVGCCGLVSAQQCYVPMGNRSVAQGILAALAVESSDENIEAIDALLILLADHELSPATFAARVAASTGCSLHSCVASAFCASGGALIAQLYDNVDDFFESTGTAAAMLRRATTLHERGMAIPGFEHPMYPHGDPRARYLLDVAKRRSHQSRQMTAIYTFVEQMAACHGLLPRHELGVVALIRAMELPQPMSAGLSMLGRVAGWLAHVQEQRLFGTVLRPRARFVGAPGSPTA